MPRFAREWCERECERDKRRRERECEWCERKR